MKPLATTFNDGVTIEVTLLTKPSSTGLCKVQDNNGKILARHRDRLTPINDLAKEWLNE